MKSTVLKDILHRAGNWPVEDQEELMRAALYIEQRRCGDFNLSVADWKTIKARLEAIRHGVTATDEVSESDVGKFKDVRREGTLDGLSWKEWRDAGRK